MRPLKKAVVEILRVNFILYNQYFISNEVETKLANYAPEAVPALKTKQAGFPTGLLLVCE
jgi:hypothetical protein